MGNIIYTIYASVGVRTRTYGYWLFRTWWPEFRYAIGFGYNEMKLEVNFVLKFDFHLL